jgi:hypothetical protein
MTAVGDSIGQKASSAATYDLEMEELLGVSLLGALICAVLVRIPRSEEKDHAL